MVSKWTNEFDIITGLKPKKTSPAKKPHPEDGFDDFWKACPHAARRAGSAKPRSIWGKLQQSDRDAIMAILHMWVQYETQKEDPQFTPHAATWLNQRRWEAYEDVLKERREAAARRADSAEREERGRKAFLLEHAAITARLASRDVSCDSEECDSLF
jgi:hypothetical protein